MPSDKMTMIYDGIVMPTDEVKMRKKNEVVHITLSGGARVKGHRDLIEAARVLLGRGVENFYIKIAGRFVDEEYLARLKELVIEYDEIKDGLGKLFEMFYRDEICNRSLFICDSQKITYMDIMNICAAFEAQFRESYGNKYKIQKQEDVKNKLVKFIENHKTELINENEEEA